MGHLRLDAQDVRPNSTLQLEIAFVLRAFDSSGVEVQEEEGGKKESSSEKMNQRTDDKRLGLQRE